MLVEERLMDRNRLQLPYGTHFDGSVDSGARNIAGLESWVQLLTQLVVAGGANHQQAASTKSQLCGSIYNLYRANNRFHTNRAGRNHLRLELLSIAGSIS